MCNQFYNTETGLAPEISYFNLDSYDKPDLDIHTNDRFSILRPETVESYFYLWRLTKNQKYRDWGWSFFQNLEKYARVENGYTSISNVMSSKNPGNRDKMESFFLGNDWKWLNMKHWSTDILFIRDYTRWNVFKSFKVKHWNIYICYFLMTTFCRSQNGYSIQKLIRCQFENNFF